MIKLARNVSRAITYRTDSTEETEEDFPEKAACLVLRKDVFPAPGEKERVFGCPGLFVSSQSNFEHLFGCPTRA
jgi:hypothetical protein